MLNDGIATMAVGMGTVFSFLIILWAVVAFLGVVVGYLNKLFPAEVQAVKTAVKTAVGDLDVAIAIAAAKLRK
jgi:Na+-transporting methylmalonyl-CoA/oxaloacetate decarboxylase gamma subunit